jgi:hypothetical protein
LSEKREERREKREERREKREERRSEVRKVFPKRKMSSIEFTRAMPVEEFLNESF